jgi:hypothetical protein
MRLANLATFATGVPLLCSCSLFTQPLANPVITERIDVSNGNMHGLAATSDRRLIVFYPDQKTCMEPPPDISENISASLTSKLSASATAASKATGSLTSDIASQVASALSFAVKPSQGILLYRAGMADLCNEYANKVITDLDRTVYWSAAKSMLDKAFALTALELLLTNGKPGPDGYVIVPQLPKLASNDAGTGTDAGSGAGEAKKPTTAQGENANPSGTGTTAGNTQPSSSNQTKKATAGQTTDGVLATQSSQSKSELTQEQKTKLLDSIVKVLELDSTLPAAAPKPKAAPGAPANPIAPSN